MEEHCTIINDRTSVKIDGSNKLLVLLCAFRYSLNGLVSLVLYIKKGTALTIPYSGEPERPRRSNYPFNGGFVSQKTLISKCESTAFISLLTYIIHDFQKKSTGNSYKLFFLKIALIVVSCFEFHIYLAKTTSSSPT